MSKLKLFIHAAIVISLLQGFPAAAQGDPMFDSEPSTWAAGSDPRAVAVADADGDAVADVAYLTRLAVAVAIATAACRLAVATGSEQQCRR